MSTPLVFMMGEFQAEFPVDRRYSRNHMWGLKQPSGHWRFGFTAYAVRLLQDVYFLDWSSDAPVEVTLGQEIGSIESKKAESSLYAPLAGRIVQFNPTLLQDPSGINVDKYDRGWLFEMTTPDESSLLVPESYLELLVGVWEKTQRTIKGQLNEG